jgi:hypothetical protein
MLPLPIRKLSLPNRKASPKLPDGRICRDTVREQKQGKYALFEPFVQVDFFKLRRRSKAARKYLAKAGFLVTGGLINYHSSNNGTPISY